MNRAVTMLIVSGKGELERTSSSRQYASRTVVVRNPVKWDPAILVGRMS